MSKFNLQIDGKNKSTTEGNSDWWYGGGEDAWQSLQDAKNGVPLAIRKGKTVGVLEDGKVVEYIWHPEDLTNDGLVVKNPISESYGYFQLQTNSINRKQIASENVLNFLNGNGVAITYEANGGVRIANTITNNNQLTNGAGYVTSSGNTIIGTSDDVSTTGSQIIGSLIMTDGVITAHTVRTLTLGNLGYTGDLNANRITNNNQITNGAGYVTSSGNTVVGTSSDIITPSAKVIDKISLSSGVITSFTLRDLTLSDLGFTGDSNANRITNNNQITNGRGFVTSSGNTIIGTDSDISNTGAKVIADLIMTDGVITAHTVRDLTLADIGFTGDANANRITNNNQITNGAGYITSFTNTQLTKEQVEDYVGGMVTGNTETNISVTYNDTTGKLNFVSVNTQLSNAQVLAITNPLYAKLSGGNSFSGNQTFSGDVGVGTIPLTGGGAGKWITLNGTTTYSGGVIFSVNSVAKAFSYVSDNNLRHQSQSGVGQEFLVNGTTNALKLDVNGNATFSGNVSANNLSGTNTGDQDLSTYWSQASIGLQGVNRISTISDFNADLPSGFYQSSSASNAPGISWYNMLNVRHGEASNQHGFQISASYYDNHIYTRTYSGGTSGSTGSFRTWAKQYSDANFIAGTDYLTPVSGGYAKLSGGNEFSGNQTFSGDVNINKTLNVKPTPDLGILSGDKATAITLNTGRQNVSFESIRTANGSDWNNTTFRILADIDTTPHQSINFVNDGGYSEHIDIYTGNQVFNTRFASDGNVEFRGNATFSGDVEVEGKALLGNNWGIKGTNTGDANDCYFSFYENDGSTQNGLIGFPNTLTSDFWIKNTLSGGVIKLRENGELYYNGDIQAQGYKSSDGSEGITSTFNIEGTIYTVKNGLITAENEVP